MDCDSKAQVSRATLRYALKVIYDGRGFAGSQIQPKQRTVEGEILKALEKVGARAENFRRACRTDRGVSAAGNVFAVTTDMALDASELNSCLPEDICILDIKRVSEDFNPRHAKRKVYKYFLLNDGYSIDAMRRAAGVLRGEHSFHNFCRLENGKNPVRKLSNIEIVEDGAFLILSFEGESFLWQMVRRLVTALKKAGRGEISIEELKKYFEPACRNKFKPSEPEPLILWSVKYNFDFLES